MSSVSEYIAGMQYVCHCTLSDCMLSLGRQLRRYCMMLLCALLGVYAVNLILGGLDSGRA